MSSAIIAILMALRFSGRLKVMTVTPCSSATVRVWWDIERVSLSLDIQHLAVSERRSDDAGEVNYPILPKGREEWATHPHRKRAPKSAVLVMSSSRGLSGGAAFRLRSASMTL